MTYTNLPNAGDEDPSADALAAMGGVDAGQAGYPLPGYPGWMAGTNDPTGGVLGVVQLADARSGSAAGGQAAGQDPYPLPPGYMYDAQGQLQLTPEFARTHPGPTDFGRMAHNINWNGVLKDLGDVISGAVMPSPLEEAPEWIEQLGLLKTGAETLNAQNQANKPKPAGAP